MPALRALELRYMELSDALTTGLFRASIAKAAPRLRSFTAMKAKLAPAAVRALAATGWRLEELDLEGNAALGGAGLAALLAAPTFALRRLDLGACGLDAAALLALADAPWPLEALDLSSNDFSAAAAGRALAALSRHVGLRSLDVGFCCLSAANFKALVEAAWPALTSFSAPDSQMEFAGPHALGAAAFAGFPALEELDLREVVLGHAGASLLGGRLWPRGRPLAKNGL
jgi:hypothetical protein